MNGEAHQHNIDTGNDWTNLAYELYKRKDLVTPNGHKTSGIVLISNEKSKTPFEGGTAVVLVAQNKTKTFKVWGWCAAVEKKEVIQVFHCPDKEDVARAVKLGRLMPERCDYYGIIVDEIFMQYGKPETTAFERAAEQRRAKWLTSNSTNSTAGAKPCW